RPKKLQRASRACDFCHKRSIRCRPSDHDGDRCQNCVDFDIACTYTRPWKRARAGTSKTAPDDPHQRRRTSSSAQQDNQSEAHPSPFQSSMGSAQTDDLRAQAASAPPGVERRIQSFADPSLIQYSKEPLGQAWKSFAIAAGPSIQTLMDVYHKIVYPIFPLFHRKTLAEKLDRREHLRDRGFFASVMAACALVSARARDGALTTWNVFGAQPEDIPSESFYEAAKDSIPKDLHQAKGHHFLKAAALLAIGSIQLGNIEGLHEFLGHYFTLSSIQRFHDEAHWPKNISPVEREERRRLFWSIYTLDIYSAIVWNRQLHSREAHVHVGYPTEIRDEVLETAAGGISDNASWIHGWNFTTDIYRVLEHTIGKLRSRRAGSGGLVPVQAFFRADTFSAPDLLRSVLDMYARLPQWFKEVPPVTGDQDKDIYGFQAANIQATLQLFRMVLFSVEELPDVDQKCQVAAELLSVFQTVPVPYLKAISTPLIYHLAGIGTILGSVMESPLSETSYQHVRSMLLSMADLLENLEFGMYTTQGTSRGLRAQVDRIDEYMRIQRSTLAPSFQNTIADLTSVDGRNPYLATNSIAVVPQTQSQFQVPPELLEDWPWPVDLNQDYGLFPF
ncbi:hypothetical protein K490DRAFT_9838, partial [Saccharata proteae CBS 121410]